MWWLSASHVVTPEVPMWRLLISDLVIDDVSAMLPLTSFLQELMATHDLLELVALEPLCHLVGRGLLQMMLYDQLLTTFRMLDASTPKSTMWWLLLYRLVLPDLPVASDFPSFGSLLTLLEPSGSWSTCASLIVVLGLFLCECFWLRWVLEKVCVCMYGCLPPRFAHPAPLATSAP